MEYRFTTELWEWEGQGAWCFVSLPSETYEDIKEISGQLKRGFGSVKVEVLIGNSKWNTSIFPDTKSKTYLLPIKKSIRKIENIHISDTLDVYVKLLI